MVGCDDLELAIRVPVSIAVTVTRRVVSVGGCRDSQRRVMLLLLVVVCVVIIVTDVTAVVDMLCLVIDSVDEGVLHLPPRSLHERRHIALRPVDV